MLNAVLSLTLLAAAPTAEAADRGPTFGVFGGQLITPQLEVLGDTAVVGPRLGYWFNPTLGVEIDVGIMPIGETQERIPESFGYMGILPTANLVGRVFETEPINLILSVGAGVFYKSIDDPEGRLGLPSNPDLDFAAISGPGLMVPLGPIALRADYKWMLTVGNDSFENRGASFINGQWTAGIQYLPVRERDADRDGIPDEADVCVEQPEDEDGFEDEDGCPDTDNDKDGILDVNEATDCLNEPEDLDDFEDEDGCPDPDNDEDGLLDEADACPIDFGPEATRGCPDADGDKVRDLDDECVNDAGTAAAFGCPDSDEDRVPDYRDDCPDEAVSARADATRSNGCPSAAFITEQGITILEKVYFSSGRDRILSKSYPVLDAVADVLTRQKGVKKVSIEGHTDSQGDDERNLSLSQRRAEAVVKYLVDKGIAEDRLEAVGLGETQPVGDNETSEGREQNRRVEFKITEQEAGRAGKTIKRGAEEAAPEGKTIERGEADDSDGADDE